MPRDVDDSAGYPRDEDDTACAPRDDRLVALAATGGSKWGSFNLLPLSLT